MGPEAYRFIDMLAEAGQRYWQVLPLGPANDKDCPYQSTSAFAGDPAYISLDKLSDQGLIEDADLDLPREEVLRAAHDRFAMANRSTSPNRSRNLREYLEAYEEFCSREASWLDDFALYSAISDHLGRDWSCWDEDIRSADEEAMAEWRRELVQEFEFYRWTQYVFFTQWEELLSYAHGTGIKIIGDIPYSVSYESADCWTHRELFMIDQEGRQLASAGAPPDYFTPEGQCWDNPLYDWKVHRERGYDWWLRRIGQQFRFFDLLRMDHMRGFESYYAIPEETKDPKDGSWEKGPGLDFFDTVNRTFDRRKFIAEDLGTLTDEVYRLIDGTGYPGMKVLQFAFDTGEENIYLPSNYRDENCVVYTGTHDNDTTRGWYEKAEDWKQRFLTWYLREKSETSFAGVDRGDVLSPEDAVRGMIELAHSSRAMLSIIPMQDYLMLGSEARTNTPGIADGNWCWQMGAEAFTDEMAAMIAGSCASYDRA